MSQLHAVSDPPRFSFPIAPTPALRSLRRSPDTLPKLVSVVAPIGYGKTVLLSALCRDGAERPGGCWWFSLDGRDVSVERLLAHLERRLDASQAGPASFDAVQMMLQGDDLDDERITRVVARMRELASPLTLFVDNLNYCHDPALARLLHRLVFDTPPWIRLVLSSTEALPLDLVRCKLEAMLKEYGSPMTSGASRCMLLSCSSPAATPGARNSTPTAGA